MRLFFAVWPDAAARAALERHAAGPWPRGARPTRPDLLHLTLAFLGEVDEARLPALTALGARLGQRATPCRMRLTRHGLWTGGIAWLAPARTPPPLAELVAALCAGLAELGIRTDARRYRPHITLARHVGAWTPAAAPAIAYPIDHLALLVSETDPQGARYRTLATWPLAGKHRRPKPRPEADAD